MGLVSGPVSYRRYRVDKVPAPHDGLSPEAALCDRLLNHGFRDIEPSSDVETTAGWVRIDDACASDFSPEDEPLRSAALLVVRLRIDTLKAFVESAARARCRQQQRERLSGKEKTQLTLEIKKDLRKRSLPKVQLVEVAWDLSSGQVRLFTTSNRVAEVFEELFGKTFEAELRPLGLVSQLEQQSLSAEELASLSLLEPERFHRIPV
jgi:hypothetical protein